MGSTPQVSRPADVKAGRGRTIRGITLVFILTSLMLTLLLEALDQTLVATAAPKIVASLHGFDRYTWVVTAYLLASTTIIPIAGKLSDQFGRKWFFVVGVVIFLLGSLLSGMAGDMNQLIIFRAIQGIGAGIGIALVFTAIGDIFPPAERPRWQGIFAGVYGFASVVGPTVGGWLSDNGPLLARIVTDTTRWRWIFYINIPIALLALLMVLIYYPNSSPQPERRQGGRKPLSRIDWTGAFLVATATICLLLGLTWGANHTYNWASPQVIIILAAAAILYILFFIVERIVAEPILPLHLLRNQVFAADSILALILGMALIALVFYLPLYFQGVLGQSAASSGVTITWFTLSLVVGSATAGIIVARLGRYQALAILSFALACVGVFLFTMMNATTSLLFIILAMVVAGIGLGIFTPMPTLVIQNGLPRSLMGAGTGAITYVRSLGQVLGPAIVGAIVNSMIGLTGPLNTARGIAGVAPKTTIVHALSGGFWSILVFCAFGLVVTFFLKDVPLAKEFVDDIAHDIAHSIYLLTQQDIQDAKTVPVSTQTAFTLRRYDKNLVKYAISELNKGEPEEAINLAIDAFSSIGLYGNCYYR
jgi:EmrB/QacA subfamily drug resistance transporter